MQKKTQLQRSLITMNTGAVVDLKSEPNAADLHLQQGCLLSVKLWGDTAHTTFLHNAALNNIC